MEKVSTAARLNRENKRGTKRTKEEEEDPMEIPEIALSDSEDEGHSLKKLEEPSYDWLLDPQNRSTLKTSPQVHQYLRQYNTPFEILHDESTHQTPVRHLLTCLELILLWPILSDEISRSSVVKIDHVLIEQQTAPPAKEDIPYKVGMDLKVEEFKPLKESWIYPLHHKVYHQLAEKVTNHKWTCLILPLQSNQDFKRL